MDHVTRSFFAMYSAKNMDWMGLLESWKNFSWEEQERLIAATLRSELGKLCPPSLQFRKSFLKYVLNELESNGAEVCDNLYEEYGQLVSICDADEGEFCYKSYFMPSGDHVTLQESTQLITQGTTGLRTWPVRAEEIGLLGLPGLPVLAAQYLAEWALEKKGQLHDKHVLELGSGLGLTGLVVRSQCLLSSYTFSDCHGAVLAQLAANIHRNQRLLQRRGCLREAHSGSDVKSNAARTHVGSKGVEEAQIDQSSKDSKPDMYEQRTNQSSISKEYPKDSMPHVCVPLKDLPHSCSESSYRTDGESKHSCNLSCLPLSATCGEEVQSGFCSRCWQMMPGDTSTVEMWQMSSDSRTRLATLHWDEVSEQDLKNVFPNVQVILAADVAYDNCNFPALGRVLKRLLTCSPGQSERIAYIANRVRNEDTIQEFLSTLESLGLTYDLEEGPKNHCFVYDQSVPVKLISVRVS